MIPTPLRTSSSLILAALFAGVGARAQCTTAWSAWPQCPGSTAVALAALPNGDVVAGGSFSTLGGVAAANIGRWDGTTWNAMATGMDDQVSALAVLPDGSVVAGGRFQHAGGLRANHVAHWNGVAWEPMSVGTNGEVVALRVLPNGDVIAGGSFGQAGGFPAVNLARWDGTSWSPLGAGISGTIRAVTSRPNGDIVVAGNFTNVGGVAFNHVASWNGTTWSPLGTGLGFFPSPVSFAQANALATLANGDVVVGGMFTQAGGLTARRVARWNGTTWSAMGPGLDGGFPAAPTVMAMTTLVDGDLVVAGTFTNAGAVPVQHVARWDVATNTWSALGTDWQFGATTVTTLPDGDVVATGIFAGTTSCQMARLTTACPAIATIGDSGCPGSGGDNTLTAVTLPWVDTTFRATGTGLPTTAIVVALTSVTAIPQGAAPLSLLFAEGVPGCDVLVAPDIVEALVTSTGTASSSLFLPSAPPLVGVTFHHQMVPIEVDAQGDWLAITATNALQLTAGSW